jgi:hypothetical protein
MTLKIFDAINKFIYIYIHNNYLNIEKYHTYNIFNVYSIMSRLNFIYFPLKYSEERSLSYFIKFP